MSPEEKKRWTSQGLLTHILESASAVEDYVQDRTLADFSNDRMLRRAVEREFTIIGEAMARLRRDFPELASRISEDHRIVAFRNQLIHGYDIINDAITWGIAMHKLPVLRSEIQALMDEVSGKADPF